MCHVTGRSDGFGTDRLTLFLSSVGGTEKCQVMHALLSVNIFPQHTKASPAGDTAPYPYCFRREIPTA